MQLRLSTRTVDGVLVVDCSGRIVFGEESASLRDAVKKLLGQSPEGRAQSARRNLHRFGRPGHAGLALHHCPQRWRRRLKLASLTQRVDDLLQVTKLVTIFEVFENEQAAVHSFKSVAA